MHFLSRGMLLVLILGIAGCAPTSPALHGKLPSPAEDLPRPSETLEEDRQVVLAGGCFWCTEAVFEELKGVKEVISGYAGGLAADAHYHQVALGGTGHAEAIRITYDPREISYGELLRVFFGVAHDPTQKDGQGPDEGTQYRSTIFYADAAQKRVARAYIDQLDAAGVFERPIATTLEPLVEFFPAEAEHQDYAACRPGDPYVRQQAIPKLKKVRELYPERTGE